MSTTKLCKKCNAPFEPTKGLINFCSISCKQSRNFSEKTKQLLSLKSKLNCGSINKKKENIDIYEQNPKFCKNCNKKLSYENKSLTFCSSSCSATHNNKHKEPMSEKTKQKISESIKNRNNINNINNMKCSCLKCRKKISVNNEKNHQTKCKGPKICSLCGTKHFQSGSTCSKKCKSEILSLTAKQNPHLNKNNNRHSGWITLSNGNRIYTESSWEVKLCRLLDDAGIPFIRPKPFDYIDSGKNKKYYPDFYVPKYDIYLEPKNPYLLSQQMHKLSAVAETYKINLLVIDDKDKINEKLLDYIKNVTGLVLY